MHILKKLGLTLFTVATIHAHGASVWKVTSGQNTVYIGGTIHLLTAEDYPLPMPYEHAYQASDSVVFETNLDILNDPAFQKAMLDKLTYAEGTTLNHVITPHTYNVLKDYLDEKNIPFEAIANLKPGLLAISLSMIELKSLGFTSEGVDQFYSRRATQDEKSQAWLESPESQIQLLDDFNEYDSDLIIRYTLSDIHNMPETMNQLRQAWREGDIKALESIGIDDLRIKYPNIYQSLLVKRNALWVPKIEKMLESTEVEFVMVGAMHLVGPDSVLISLKENGYQITPLK